MWTNIDCSSYFKATQENGLSVTLRTQPSVDGPTPLPMKRTAGGDTREETAGRPRTTPSGRLQVLFISFHSKRGIHFMLCLSYTTRVHQCSGTVDPWVKNSLYVKNQQRLNSSYREEILRMVCYWKCFTWIMETNKPSHSIWRLKNILHSFLLCETTCNCVF